MSTLVDFRNHIFENLEDIHYILDKSGFHCDDVDLSMATGILRYEISAINFIFIETKQNNPEYVDICYNQGGNMSYYNKVKVGEELLLNLRKNIYYYILLSGINEFDYKNAKFNVVLERNSKKVVLSNKIAKKEYLKRKEKNELKKKKNDKSFNIPSKPKRKIDLNPKKAFIHKKKDTIHVHKYKLADEPQFILDYEEINLTYCEVNSKSLSYKIFKNVTKLNIRNCNQLDDLMWLSSFPNLKKLIIDSPKKRIYPSTADCFIQYI